jgi:hypothetical protein
MKKVYLSLGVSALLASLTFVGCGSGSTSSSSSSTPSTGTLSLNPTLGNIDYSCGSNSGTTNDNGEYKYNSGDVCTFTFGGLQLTANPGTKLTIDDILEDKANSSVSKEAIWAYVSAATGLTQSELSSLGKAKISDTFKSATDDILDFSSFDKFAEKLLADTDVDDDIKIKFEKNKGKISSAKTAQRVEVKFQEIATPTTEETKNTQQVSTTVNVNGVDQTISYNTIIRTGDTNNNEIFGQVKDYNDTAITFGIDSSPYICNGTNEGVGSGLDYTSFLNKDGKIYMVSQFECQIGAMYMAELDQEPNTGALTIKDDSLKFISQKDEFGGFVHCAGQRTPWESHLGSEEYETNARMVELNAKETGLTGDPYYDETAKYWGGDAKKLSPYYYGWTPEVKIEAGEPDYTKHYSMGRFSHELSYVMPDNKTIYMSDDGTNVGLFMFVADVAKDLSAGTLYAAKWNQTSEDGVGAGEADITWVSLGHANDSEVRKYLDADSNVTTNDALKFSDIFDSVDGAGGSCTEGYTSINTSAGHECLKIKDGMELAASRLETRRYAAIKGATTEFRKEEGITFDKNSGKLYVSMSEVKKGMEDNGSNDLGGNNHIRVAKNACGAVYALDISTSSVKDTSDSIISSKYVVKNMNAIIEGTPTTYADGVYANNTCNVNGISNPDNISFLENSDILSIGEDTSSHENNVVWAYNVKTKELTRTFTTPLEAEATSTFWYSDLKDGFGYMSIVTQHPGDTTTDNAQTALGYIGAFKNLTELNKTESIDSIERIGTYKTSKKAGSEIVAYDKDSKKMFTTNGADNTLDISTISYNSETKETTVGTPISVTLAPYGAGVQSVTAMNGKVAVAVGSANKVTTKGKVLVFDTNGVLLSQTQVGYLPDMVTFNEDGTKVIVANEGEPDASTGTYVDVKGTIGILTIAEADASDNANGYAEVDFSNATLSAASDTTPVRLGGTPSNDKALDIEPEYITVKGDYAYVTLQENNALAKVNISGATPTLELVKSFGAKDYSTQNTIDIEEEGYALLKNYKGLNGLYMPDSIASYTVEGKTYLVTANEGDGREYCSSVDAACDNPIFADEKKISKLTLDGSISADYANENDLKVVTDMGATNGVYEKLYTFGTRSFTIWDDNGELVWDSGDEFAKLTSKMMPTLFNQDNGSIDGRSGNKGVEPEALAVGKVGNKTYAFVGFERQNVIVVYDITVPTKSKFVKFINTQKDGDISPEGMKFVEASNSPTGNALLFVAYEMSGSTSIYEIK